MAGQEICDRFGDRLIGGDVIVRDRVAEDRRHRNHAGPGRPADVLGFVRWHTGPDLGHRVLNLDRDDCGRLEFLIGHLPHFIPPARQHLFAEPVEGVQLLIYSGQQAADTIENGRAVVNRVVEDRAGQHDPIGIGERDADRFATARVKQRPVGAVTVEEDCVAIPGMKRRQHLGLAVNGIGDVADQLPGTDLRGRFAIEVEMAESTTDPGEILRFGRTMDWPMSGFANQ